MNNQHSLKQRLNAVMPKIMTTLIMLSPSVAFASAGDDQITEALRNIGAYLGGAPAIAAGTLALIGIGFRWLTGKMEIQTVIVSLLCLAMILSAGFIIHTAYPSAAPM